MVGRKVISGFRGVIDFYYYMGIPVARTWPRKPSMKRAPEVQATIRIFKQANIIFPQISPEVRQAYRDMVGSTNITWKDMFFRGYISGTLRYFFPPGELEED